MEMIKKKIVLLILVSFFSQQSHAFSLDSKISTAASWFVKTLPTTSAILEAYIISTARSKAKAPSQEILTEAQTILKGLGEDPDKFEIKLFSTPILQTKHVAAFVQFMDQKADGTFVIYMSAGGLESNIISQLDRYGLLFEHIIRALYSKRTKRELVVTALTPFFVALFYQGVKSLIVPEESTMDPEDKNVYKYVSLIYTNPVTQLITSVVILAQTNRFEVPPLVESKVQKEADRIIKKYK